MAKKTHRRIYFRHGKKTINNLRDAYILATPSGNVR